MEFLKNTWYVAAWSDEIGEALFHRTVIGVDVLFFRLGDGSLRAMGNRCPHRYAPLHMGTRIGDTVRCIYHGLTFDGQGRCVHNPHGNGNIPGAARVLAYPVVERHAAVWIWMGDPALADPATIPDYSFVERTPATAMTKGYLPTKAAYDLLVDNILDLSHVDYLHAGSLATGAFARAPAQVEEADGDLHVRWFLPSAQAFGVVKPFLPRPDALVDISMEVRWSPLGNMLLKADTALAGGTGAPPFGSNNLHLMTPESATSTHYFFLNTRDYAVGDAALNAARGEALTRVFAQEDKPVVEAQQDWLGTRDLLDTQPVLLPIDGPAVRCRRIVKRLIATQGASAIH